MGKQAAFCGFWRTRAAVHRWKVEVFHVDSGFCLWAEHKHMALNELNWKKAYDWALLYVLFSGMGASADLKTRRHLLTWSLNCYDVCVEVERVSRREAFLSAQREQIAAADGRMANDQMCDICMRICTCKYEPSDDIAGHKFDDSRIYHIYCRGSPQGDADYDGYNGGDNDWVEEFTGA